ncbi:hypothetical protein TRFO_04469 [Tritrichomonas foetus]|uniref:Uncharacterized protein n=1 Tax=Tritrichomonas foetus TaxID=1144522 RepID=A0A1J4KEP3_9EUKA|nr:hypothetical protein TRFO_04469 [Tritrichomonas foetus]|eukprot:OHT09913.1 hypothetical protein TRFO_04469 [Tritrichomonas foetus]
MLFKVSQMIVFFFFYLSIQKNYHTKNQKAKVNKGVFSSESIQQLLNEMNSDDDFQKKIKRMIKSGEIPKSIMEESDELNGGYVRCRPFVVSRRSLKSVVDRYAKRAMFDSSKDEQDATLMAYQMLPNSVNMNQFRNHASSGTVQQFAATNSDDDDNDAIKGDTDPEMIGVSQPESKRTQILHKEQVSPAMIARHLKLSQPEQLRLHLRAKPKIPLCRNTIILI